METNENVLPKETINQLTQAFQATNEALLAFDSQMKQAVNSCYKLALITAQSRALTYLEKVLKSTWVTRWYWKLKYNKSMKELDALIAINPPPEHFPCRCESKIQIK